MKKFQAPVIGGFRKMITLPPTSVGTTIAEVGSGTITLTQLAAAINNILQGSNSVTTAAAASIANLVLGPGLAGGGALTGNVPLSLTAPIPWGIMEDGADGDIGPPGIQGPIGATGATGPQGPQGPAGSGTGGAGGVGTLMMFVPDDTSYDDFLIPGPVGPTGAVGATGPQGPAGTGSGGGGTGNTMFMVPEDPVYDDEFTQRAPPNLVGPNFSVIGTMSVVGTGSTLPSTNQNIISLDPVSGVINMYGTGNKTITASEANIVFTISAPLSGIFVLAAASTFAISLNSIATFIMGTSSHAALITGVTAGNVALGINGVSGISALIVTGSGVQVGTPKGGTSGEMGSGTVNVSGNYFINGQPILGGAQSQAVSGAFMTHDDPYWEEEILKGVPSVLGNLTVNSTLTVGPPGLPQHSIIANGASGAFAFNVNGSPVVGASFGLALLAGSTSADLALDIVNQADTNVLFQVYGDGGVVVGSPVGATLGLGTLNVAGAISAQGATPAAAAGRTDIGTTTTATVITTAGGIALPALAKTFWVVNVNGVQYGIPCFAL